MILIADSSALIALAICDGLKLLEPLYGEVLVPEAVYNEVALSNKPESATLREYLAGKVRSVDTSGFVYLDASADLGETEAMLLYKQLNADKLLIDDRRGRKIAKIHHRLARRAACGKEQRSPRRSLAKPDEAEQEQHLHQPGCHSERAGFRWGKAVAPTSSGCSCAG